MNLIIKYLGIQPYQTIYAMMQQFTTTRCQLTSLKQLATPDEIWLLQHEPVYTQGQAGKAEHILNQLDIPVVQSDRGGQVTYHGPGQLLAYVMLDLHQLNLGIRSLVTLLEQAVIDLLSSLHIIATSRATAPGVYVNNEKICSIGLRIRRGCSYHGLALNVDMELSPFNNINPCGYKGLKMTQIKDHRAEISMLQVTTALAQHLMDRLGHKYNGNI